MALRKAHGKHKNGPPRIEVLPADELPKPIPVAVPDPASQLTRRPDGTLADSESAKALGAKGGLAKAQKRKLLQNMGLAHVADDNTFKPYYNAAQAWLEATIGIYAAMCGGALGPGPSALLGNAAIALAFSRWLTDKAFSEQNELHARQALRYWDSMKQQKLAAYELGIREARMRSELSEGSAVDAFEEALRAQKEAEDGNESGE